MTVPRLRLDARSLVVPLATRTVVRRNDDVTEKIVLSEVLERADEVVVVVELVAGGVDLGLQILDRGL